MSSIVPSRMLSRSASDAQVSPWALYVGVGATLAAHAACCAGDPTPGLHAFAVRTCTS
jgi:hypothetical protein